MPWGPNFVRNGDLIVLAWSPNGDILGSSAVGQILDIPWIYVPSTHPTRPVTGEPLLSVAKMSDDSLWFAAEQQDSFRSQTGAA